MVEERMHAFLVPNHDAVGNLRLRNLITVDILGNRAPHYSNGTGLVAFKNSCPGNLLGSSGTYIL